MDYNMDTERKLNVHEMRLFNQREPADFSISLLFPRYCARKMCGLFTNRTILKTIEIQNKTHLMYWISEETKKCLFHAKKTRYLVCIMVEQFSKGNFKALPFIQ